MKVVFISGWGSDEKVWFPITTNIDMDFIHISWWECLGYSLNDNALLKFLSDIEKPVIVIGWSLGGMIAMHASITFPTKVLGMVIISSTPRMLSDKDYKGVNKRVLKAMKAKLSFNSLELLKDFATMSDSPSCNKLSQKNFTDSAETIDIDKLYKGLEFLEKTDMRDNLSDVKIPISILVGDNDKIIEPSNSIYLKNSIDKASLRTISDEGHFLIFHKPKLIADSIKQLISKVENLKL